VRIKTIASLCVALALLVSGTAFAKQPAPWWIFEGCDGPATEYIYPTGEPGEAGIPIEAMGESGIMAFLEPGPTPPTDKFVWVLPSTVNYLNDVFNIPRSTGTTYTLHTGLDAGWATTQRIYSAYGGQVTLANPTYDTTTWGSLSKIKHPSATSCSYITVYGHWSDWEDALVPVGTTYPAVYRGQAVGYVGTGGLPNMSPHLHFSVTNSAGTYVSPAPYFSSTCVVPPSQMEFIVHTPVGRYVPAMPVAISITSGRPADVQTALPPVVKYRAKGTTTYSTGIMVKSSSTWTFTIPGSFTATCPTGLQYFIRVYRISGGLNLHDDNYSTRPVYGAHVDPPTPYTVLPQ